jgi:hypothetical protein
MKHLLTSLALLTCVASAQSGLTLESWNNLPQSDSIIVLQQKGISARVADATTTVASTQVNGVSVAKTGQRLRGTITPTLTDTYTFWVSGADNVALWISDDASRFNKKLVAYHLGTSNVAEYDKHPNQKAIPIQLTGGQSYYVEAQVMDVDGGGHVEIAWRGQSGRYALNLNGATATQSTTQWNMTGANAIDGKTGGSWNEANLTTNVPNSWLQVDLGQDRDINQVVLYNINQNQNRLSNFRLSVLDVNNVELIGQDFFTTSGNVGNSMNWDIPSTVTGARKIKVQLLGNNLAGNGHLSIAEIEVYGAGLVTGQVNHREAIPGTYLNTLQADATDTNDNNLSDTWETQTGLAISTLPGALAEYGDPDQDGISNYQEQWLGSDPLTKEALGNGLTRYIWMGINGSVMTNFTLNNKFYTYPNAIDHVPTIDGKLNHTLYGVRYRGAIVAPTTGEYRFWISGNGGGAELWISDGSISDPTTSSPLINRFGKRLICSSGGLTPRYDYDYSPSQRSAVITLTAGQEYYIEALHTVQNGTNEHVSVAWQAPGGARQVVPNTTFLSNESLSSDADDDNLPDTWETSQTLDPTKNGFNDLNQSEYGDPDADKLTNLQEYQNGTDPKDSDTDNDGYSDSDEINLYSSDPTVSNNLAPVTLTLPALNNYTNATGSWVTQSNGTLLANERRGGITYTFTVDQPGVHEVAVVVGLLQPYYWYTQYLKLSLTMNNDSLPFASDVLTYQNSPKTMRAVTPWLAAGTHSITLYHDNYNASLRLRLDSLTVKRLGGTDLDENNVPDWLETKVASENALTNIPTQSRTSPVSVEGITQQITATTLGVLPPGATTPTNVPVTASINNTFFADVPLSATGAVTLNASMQSGLVTESHNITWTATNLFESFTNNTLHIRKGDALRLDAWSGASADGQPFTVTSNGTLLADPTNQNTTHTSGVPITATFATAGTYTLVATHNSQTATVTVQVHEANFGASHLTQINIARTWTPTTLGASHVVESDERIVFTETTTTGARKFLAKADKPITRYVLARLPENIDGAPSAVLTRGTVHAFDLGLVDRTGDAQVVHRYEDGTWLMRSTVVAVNLPEGVTIRMTLTNQGSLFTNGSNILDITSEDFDANGIAEIYYEYTGTTAPKLCHTTQVLFQP